jgi:hypothetical protein
MYVGTKVIKALPMTRQEYNDYRSWQMLEDETDCDGFLVEYLEGGKSNDIRHKGYISWSPADVFNNAYKASGEYSFGHAIELAKLGYKIARSGWNGKGMWVIYNPGSLGQTHAMFDGSVYKNHGVDECEILPHFDMYTINAYGRRAMLPGWLASQTDMLATDWCII